MSMITAQLRRVLGGQDYTTTQLGEPDIPTLTDVSPPHCLPSGEYVYISKLLLAAWWKTVMPPFQSAAEGEPKGDIPTFGIVVSALQFVPSKIEYRSVPSFPLPWWKT